jgi:hypothetical protein
VIGVPSLPNQADLGLMGWRGDEADTLDRERAVRGSSYPSDRQMVQDEVDENGLIVCAE